MRSVSFGKQEDHRSHHYKCDVLVSQEAFGKRIAEDKIKVAWLQQGSCLIYAKTIQRQGVFTAEDGNILFFLRKIVSNDLEIKMELYAGYSRNALFCSKYFLQFRSLRVVLQ